MLVFRGADRDAGGIEDRGLSIEDRGPHTHTARATDSQAKIIPQARVISIII